MKKAGARTPASWMHASGPGQEHRISRASEASIGFNHPKVNSNIAQVAVAHDVAPTTSFARAPYDYEPIAGIFPRQCVRYKFANQTPNGRKEQVMKTVLVHQYWRRPPNSNLFERKSVVVSTHTRRPPNTVVTRRFRPKA
jgi:hypothetical protein